LGQSGAPDWPKSVSFSDPYRGVAVGDHETVWRTANGGAEWEVSRGLGAASLGGAVNLASVTRNPASPQSIYAVGAGDPLVWADVPPKGVIYKATLFHYAPTAPSGLSVAARSPGPATRVTWTDNSSDEVRFEIERATDSAGPYSVVGTVAAGVATYNDSLGTDWASAWYYRVRAWNQAGFSSYSPSVGFNTAPTAPAAPIGLSATPSGWATGPTVSLNWTNPVTAWAPIAAKYYKLDSVPTTSTNGTRLLGGDPNLAIGATDGTHTVYVWLEDAAGLKNEANRSSTTIYVDRNAPGAVSALAAAPSDWASATTFNLTWTNPSDSGSALSRHYKLGSAPTGPTDFTGGEAGSTPSLTVSTSQGQHTVYVWLDDVAGNSGWANAVPVTVYADTVAPGAISGLAATPPSWVSTTTFRLTWTPQTDTGSPLSRRYKFGTAPAAASDGILVAGSTPSLSVTAPGQGEYTVWVWLEDAAGNSSHTNARSTQVMADTVAPGPPLHLTSTPGTWTTGPVTLSWENPSSDATITDVYYSIDVAPTSTNGQLRLGNTPSLSVNPSTAGTHTVYIWLKDAAGNVDHTTAGSAKVLIKSAPKLSPVYRFYNYAKDVHFYTASEVERQSVLGHADWPFTPEGVVYRAFAENSAGTKPVYRFYNYKLGAHFYTASEEERALVLGRTDWPFTPEGIAYYVSASDVGALPVYRFYNRRTGVHFYTASEVERQSVLGNADWPFTPEGIAYYVPN
jgi:hypothetical protein